MTKLKQHLPSIIALIVGGVVVLLSMLFLKPPFGWGFALVLGLVVFLTPIVLRNPAFGLALVGFFLPFERIPTIEIADVSVKINHLLIIFVLIMSLAASLKNKTLKIPRDPMQFLIAFFILSMTFSYSVAVNETRALQVILFMILMLIVYLTVTLIVQDRKSLFTVVKGILWGASVVGVLGVFQFLGDKAGLPNTITLLKEGYDKSTFGFARIQGFSQEPLYFANYIFIPFLILVVLTLRGGIEKVLNKTWGYLLGGILLVDFIIAVSRGAYLAALVVFVVLLIAQAKIIFRAKVIIPVILCLALVSGAVYLALVKSERRALDEFVAHVQVQDRTEGESVVSRLNASREALDLFSENFLFGAGAGNFGPRVQGSPNEMPEGGWFIVNNEYLEILAENGIIGAIVFAAIIFVTFFRLILSYTRIDKGLFKSLILGLSLALIGILAQYATFSTIYIFHIWFLFGLCGAVSNIILDQESRLSLGLGSQSGKQVKT